MSSAAMHNQLLVGFLAIIIGLLLYQFAHGLARFSEQLDSIGSTTRTSEVEPARWKVALYRGGALLLAGIGVFLVGRSVLYFLF